MVARAIATSAVIEEDDFAITEDPLRKSEFKRSYQHRCQQHDTSSICIVAFSLGLERLQEKRQKQDEETVFPDSAAAALGQAD